METLPCALPADHDTGHGWVQTEQAADHQEAVAEVVKAAQVWRWMRADGPVWPKPESVALSAAVDALPEDPAGRR